MGNLGYTKDVFYSHFCFLLLILVALAIGI